MPDVQSEIGAFKNAVKTPRAIKIRPVDLSDEDRECVDGAEQTDMK